MPGLPDTEPAPELPAGPRLALVIATATYTDTRLRRLRAPAQDAKTLATLLRDPAIGGFSVTSVVNRPAQAIRAAVDDFLADRSTQDLLLVYLSCHGLLDAYRRLFFAATDTVQDRLQSTGVEAAWILDQLEHCRARRQILILDSCFSGAFAHGAKGEADLGLQDRFAGQGRGRVVLTASTATEYSFEGEPTNQAATTGSAFTAALVEGLRTGAADTDHDGYISVDEAYAYAFDQVQAAGAAQTPQRWLYGAEGKMVLARSPAGRRLTLAPLPESLRSALENPLPAIRIAAVNELGTWLTSGDTAREVTARYHLGQVADGDIPRVAEVARAVLDVAGAAVATSARADNARDRQDTRPATTSARRKASTAKSPRTRVGPSELVLTLTSPKILKITTVAFSPDAHLLACVCDTIGKRNSTIWLWDPATGRHLRTIEGEQIRSIAFSPDGSTLATVSYAETQLWNPRTGKNVRTLDSETHGAEVIAFSSDGGQVITAGRQMARVIDAASGQIQSSFKITSPGSMPAVALKTVTGRKPFVTVVALSRDGRLLATGHWGRNVQIWDTGTGQNKRTLKHERVDKYGDSIGAVAFSPDGDQLVTTNDAACLWDLATGRQPRILGDRASGTSTFQIQAIVFAPDGRLVATGDWSGNVRLWNASTGKHLRSLPVKSAQDSFGGPNVTALAFSPDGRQLAVGMHASKLGTRNRNVASDEPAAWLDVWV